MLRYKKNHLLKASVHHHKCHASMAATCEAETTKGARSVQWLDALSITSEL